MCNPGGSSVAIFAENVSYDFVSISRISTDRVVGEQLWKAGCRQGVKVRLLSMAERRDGLTYGWRRKAAEDERYR